MGKLLKSASIVLLFIAYPFLSAYLVEKGFSSLELLVFAALTVWRGLKLEILSLRISALLLAALLLVGAYFANTYFIWLIPSFVYLWLTALFGHTLWSPPSLCERLVRLQYPEFIPGIVEYLREVTWAWTLFFAVNGVVCTLLPVFVGQRAWAFYTGVLVYVLMGCLFVGEWVYRHRRFPNLDIPPAMETIKYMVQHGHKAFKGGWS